ncbi:MAG: right-handed parallel beta-helix repeat-containing protein [Cyclonatronaceae bacterium]
MKKNHGLFGAVAILTVIMSLVLLQNPVTAQEYVSVMDITAHDIHQKVLGPQTTGVVMEGYNDRKDYHEIRYISVNTGSDIDGDGSRGRPWASITHTLEQINDARLSRRYALLVGAGKYEEGEIFMKEFVHLYGGFDPGSWSRDIVRYTTRVDGKGQHRLITAADHSKIDGFMFVNGQVRGNGGAILCDGTSPVITNNQFRDNRSLGPDPWDPEFIHEIANDGGAIAALNGARPVIFSNLFAENSTVNGRGGAIGAHNRAAPRIQYNVFIGNRSGTDDPMRSSDGGAIAASFYSDADIFFNLVIQNSALASNDGGGIFSEMWSSMHIAGNIILGNRSDDDGGGIYLSGSVHHYITGHEAKVPEERYLNRLVGNVIAGNRLRTPEGVSGGFRFTYFTRVYFNNNITYDNTGGLDFRRTHVSAENNLVLEDVVVRENSKANFKSNRFFGELVTDDESVAETTDTRIADISKPDLFRISRTQFRDDSRQLEVQTAVYDPVQHVTTLAIRQDVTADQLLINRVVSAGGNWSVIRDMARGQITLWGDHQDVTAVTIYPSFAKR